MRFGVREVEGTGLVPWRVIASGDGRNAIRFEGQRA